MLKETILCIIIVITISICNVVTQQYTVKSINEISGNLEEMKEIIGKLEDGVQSEEAIKKVDDISKIWEEKHNKLAVYIEHDELEKFENNLESLKSYTSTKVYEDATNEIDKGIFILEHIEDKYAFNLQNIF